MNENNGRYDSENRYVQQNDTDRNATGFYTALYGSQEPSVPVPPAQNDWLNIEKELPKSNDAKKIIPAAIAAVVVIVLIVAAFAAQTRKKPSGGGTPAVSPRTPVTDVPAREDQPVPVTAHIYFDANGGMADYTERTGCIGDAYGQLPDAAKDGCEFVGWFTEREGGESVTPYTEIKAANETVYAHWVETVAPTEGSDARTKEEMAYQDPKTTVKAQATAAQTTSRSKTAEAATYTLFYNANGGSGVPSSQSGGTRYTVSYSEPKRSGYSFVGWSTDPYANYASYFGGDSVILSANSTLYAVWEKETYTLSYNANGGSGVPSSQQGNGSVVLSSSYPSRNGYTFLGWALNSSASSAQYSPGSTYYLSENTTLYAVWKQNKIYTVTFNANGGSCSISSRSVEEGETVSLPTPSRRNYDFTGWFTATNGGTRYNDSKRIYSDVTLYAHWEPIQSSLHMSFTPTVSWNNGNPTVHFECSIQSNYPITDYKVSNNLNSSYYYMNPDCVGKYYGQNLSANQTFAGHSAGTTVVYTVMAKDSSGNTVTNKYYATL